MRLLCTPTLAEATSCWGSDADDGTTTAVSVATHPQVQQLPPAQTTATKPVRQRPVRYELNDIKSAASGQWSDIFTRVGGVDDDYLDARRHGPCPECGGGSRADRWRVFNDFSETGGCTCNRCGHFADGFAFLQRRLKVSFAECLRLVAEFLGVPEAKKNSEKSKSKKTDRKAGIIQRDAVYSRLIHELPLSDDHRQALRDRGFTDADIDGLGYGSIDSTGYVPPAVVEEFGIDLLARVPGIRPGQMPILAATNALAIPVRDTAGRITAIQVRPDRPGKGPKYRWLSHRDGASSGTPAHLAGTVKPGGVLRSTEGPLKADLAHAISGVPTAAVAGVNCWREFVAVIEKTNPGKVLVAFDADSTTNKAVANATRDLIDWLKKSGIDHAIETWDIALGKGIDDLLAAGHQPDLIEGPEAIAAYLGSLAGGAKDGEIRIEANETTAIAQVIQRLASQPNIYQRGGVLSETLTQPAAIGDDVDAMTIRPIPPAKLRTLVSGCCEFFVEAVGGERLRKSVPGRIPTQVAEHGEYPGVRQLLGVAEHPVLRPDGSVATNNGYDAATRTMISCSCTVPAISPEPTRDDALRAAERLLDLFVDFPFSRGEHRSAWVASLLTMFARPAIVGPVPMTLLDASTPGTGKSRLTDIAAIIATGRPMPRSPLAGREEERKKAITAILLSGQQLVNFDNCHSLGGASMEALATSESWTDRILGASESTTELPNRTQIFVTGNNVDVTRDMSRRLLHVRLEPDVERPDSRTDFAIGDILGHVRRNRGDLIAACLIILRAYQVAGQPIVDAEPWGSFESWSRIVRDAVVWLGLVDPRWASVAMSESAAAESPLGSLIDALAGAGIPDSGWTTAQVIDAATEEMAFAGGVRNQPLRTVLDTICDGRDLSIVRVGRRLKKLDGQIHSKMKFTGGRCRATNKNVWRVAAIE